MLSDESRFDLKNKDTYSVADTGIDGSQGSE